mmetsp:Transcript_27558/g.70195  ORF Transcript_27558/g.70195 Transcript_27558/m.70195 type:complete len:516 (+) Transcript_27558:87-1634(+)
MPPSRSASGPVGVTTPLNELSQARYERQLLNEITKLQTALADERSMLSAQRHAAQEEAAAERERKASASDKADKLRAMEMAIEATQKDEQKNFMKRRAKADARMAQKEAEAARERAIEAKKREVERQMAQRAHQDGLARAAEEREAMAESKRQQDMMKEHKLQERLALERQQMLEKNLLKADEAAAKVERAAQQRIAMTQQQRQAYAERMALQAIRMDEQRQKQEQKARDSKLAAAQKHAQIERAQQQQKALLEARKQSILQAEAQKQAELDLKAEREAQARAEQRRERRLQEAASRGRVERTMGDLQSQLSTLEGQLETRTAKVEDFVGHRRSQMVEAQQLAVSGALERAAMANSMAKMRENLQCNHSLGLNIPPERRAVQNPELKALLRRLDPDDQGEIPLAKMRSTLTKLLPPEDESALHKGPKKHGTQSMPSLTSSLETLHMSRYEKAVAAFKACDIDGSGTISKRELYNVLRKAGLSNGKQALEVFAGADSDQSGSLDFEEFERIAKAIC